MRLVDADNLLISLNNAICMAYGKINYEFIEGVVNQEPIMKFEDLRPIAHWNHWPCDDEEDSVYCCSNCGEQFYEDFFYPRETPCLGSEKYKPFKYCPYCGAKMEERCTNETD